MVAPTIRAAGTTGGSFSSATSVSTGYPATVVAGDVALLMVVFSSPLPVVTPPSGFQVVAEYAGVNFGMGVYWRRCNGSEGGGSVTTSFGVASTGTSRMGLYADAQGVGAPFESLGTLSGTSATAATASIVTTGPDRLGVRCIGFRRNVQTAETSPWLELFDTGANAARQVQEYLSLPTPGSTAGNDRALGASVEWCTASLALLPAQDPVVIRPDTLSLDASSAEEVAAGLRPVQVSEEAAVLAQLLSLRALPNAPAAEIAPLAAVLAARASPASAAADVAALPAQAVAALANDAVELEVGVLTPQVRRGLEAVDAVCGVLTPLVRVAGQIALPAALWALPVRRMRTFAGRTTMAASFAVGTRRASLFALRVRTSEAQALKVQREESL